MRDVKTGKNGAKRGENADGCSIVISNRELCRVLGMFVDLALLFTAVWLVYICVSPCMLLDLACQCSLRCDWFTSVSLPALHGESELDMLNTVNDIDCTALQW